MHGHGTHRLHRRRLRRSERWRQEGRRPETQLLIGKVLGDNGGGSDSMIIGGMEWAVAQGADVISMSLGSNGAPAACNDPMSSAAQELATTSSSLFVIAGNKGSANNTVSAPGCAPAVLTVGAVDREDVPAWFSSRGPGGRPQPQAGDLGTWRRHLRRALGWARRQRVCRHVGHVDGDATRRGCCRHRQGGAPDLDRAAAQGSPRLVREVGRSR